MRSTPSSALLTALTAIALLSACSRVTPSPQGVATFDEIQAVAESFVLQGDSNTLFKHMDFAGVPADGVQQAKAELAEWHGVPNELKLSATDVMTIGEYESLQRKDFALLSPNRWGVTPEKMIVFNLGSKDPQDMNFKLQFAFGAFQAQGKWFLAASYK